MIFSAHRSWFIFSIWTAHLLFGTMVLSSWVFYLPYWLSLKTSVATCPLLYVLFLSCSPSLSMSVKLFWHEVSARCESAQRDGRVSWSILLMPFLPLCTSTAPCGGQPLLCSVGLPAHFSPRFIPDLAPDRKLMHCFCTVAWHWDYISTCFLDFVVLFSSLNLPLPWGSVLPVGWFANKFYFLFINI